MTPMRIPRPGPMPRPDPKLLSPPAIPSGIPRRTDRSVSAPTSPTPGSPPPRKARPRANTRVPSPLASPEANHVRQTKSSFARAPRATSPAPSAPNTQASSYTTRRPVPAYSDRETGIPHAATRKISAPPVTVKIKAMPIQSLSGKLPAAPPTRTPLAPAKTIGRNRSTSFSLKPKLKAKPSKPAKPPEPKPSTFLSRAVSPARAFAAPRATQAMSMNVPPHIRLRLRLIHQLSVVLDIPPAKVSAVMDIPGLLARVDGVFKKGGMTTREREGSVVSIPGEAVRGKKQEDKWWMYPPNWSAGGDEGGSKLSGENRGVLERLRKFGKREEARPESQVNRMEEWNAEAEEPLAELEARDEVEEDTPRVNPFAWMGSAFGVPVMDLPAEAWCKTRFGGHIHEIPLVLYLTIEHIWKHGNTDRVEYLCEVFAKPPLYGDQYPLQNTESPHNMASVLKRWLRDLPEPIIDDALGPALWTFCAEVDMADLTRPPSPSRINAARILLQLLPLPSFSIMTYLLAFFSQLALTIENKLGRDAIAIIFGPALITSRSHGVPGLGPRSRGCKDPDAVSVEVDRSQKTLNWLVAHWPKIAVGIMDCAIPDPLAKAAPITAVRHGDIDRRLLSPIDLRKPGDKAHTRISPDLDVDGTGRLDLSFDLEREPKKGMTKSESHTGLGLLTRAFSSRSISSLAEASEPQKSLKKSQSFSNLSELVKRTLGGGTKIDPVTIKPITRDLDDLTLNALPPPLRKSISVSSLHSRAPSDQITSVLGGLQDLLITKDRQIERDARELAVLRHTLLEMDEKLQRACACGGTPKSRRFSTHDSPDLPTPETGPATPSTPEITITASDSAQEIKDSVVLDLQSQLSTAMSALESMRVKSRTQAERITHLEASMEKSEKWYDERVQEKEGELALEIARGKGWRLERDVARRRLDKVKEDLFGVSE